MNFLKYEVEAGPESTIEVTLSSQANVRLLDSTNFHLYRNGRAHRYFGGLARRSPFLLHPPHHGHWYVVVDLGGYAGSVKAAVRVLS